MCTTSSPEPPVLFARQPIFDRDLSLAGFELLFRDHLQQQAAPADFDGNTATSRVLINAFSESDIESVCQNKPAFVNFTADTLLADLPFAAHQLVVEVLEDVPATSSVIEAIRGLRQRGFRIALDDCGPDDANHPLLAYADIVKLEYPQFSANDLAHTVAALREARPDIQILAEKVETWADFERCQTVGCDLFQGYFIARPEPVPGRTMPIAQVNIIQLLAKLNDPYASIEDISTLLSNDPFLSLRVLQLVNSAGRRPMREIVSLHKAILALGLAPIRAFASLLMLSKLQDKPHALQQLAVARGAICRSLCEHLPIPSEMGFTTGLLSCLDAMLDRPLVDILDRISFDARIVAALTKHEGPLGIVLQAVLLHENGEFDAIPWADLAKLDIYTDTLMAAFRHGTDVANQQSRALAP